VDDRSRRGEQARDVKVSNQLLVLAILFTVVVAAVGGLTDLEDLLTHDLVPRW
jgi:hypothetical protein